MDETAKEIAKTTNKVLEVAEKVGGFFATVLGDACKEMGASIHDWAKLYRYRNLLRISDKVQEIHKKRKIEGRSIPVQPQIGIPMLEAASIVEDDYLQQKWAALISNATDPKNKTAIRKSYIDILSSMDPSDAMVLDWMDTQRQNIPSREITIKIISEKLNLSLSDAKITIINLSRLGLINIQVPTLVGRTDINASSEKTCYTLNQLGETLLNLCKFQA